MDKILENNMLRVLSAISLGGFLTGLLLCSTACQQRQTCKYKPSPVFEAGLPHIVQYNFEKKGQQSLESMLLDTGVLLELSQNVCDETQQEYRFLVQGDYTRFPDSLWLREASRQLVFLSTLSPKQAALKAWADVIEQLRGDMKLGEDRAVQPGVYVRVDRITGPDQSTLVLLFSQKDEN
jgi:hypothetical protein